MNPQIVKDCIIRWTSTCYTRDQFDCIQLAINSCLFPLKKEYPIELVDECEAEIENAVYLRKRKLGLIERAPSCDEQQDNDSAFEKVYEDEQPTDIVN